MMTEINIIKKIVSSIFFILVIVSTILFAAKDAHAARINNESEARSFCTATPPDGLGGTIFTESVAGVTQTDCVINGRHAALSTLIGQDTEDLRALFGEDDVGSAGDAGTGQSEIDNLLATGVNILTGIAGLAIVGSIVVGGIQYGAAGGNAAQVSAAKNRIVVAVASLLLLGFGYALLQWLIPGGVFN